MREMSLNPDHQIKQNQLSYNAVLEAQDNLRDWKVRGHAVVGQHDIYVNSHHRATDYVRAAHCNDRRVLQHPICIKRQEMK